MMIIKIVVLHVINYCLFGYLYIRRNFLSFFESAADFI